MSPSTAAAPSSSCFSLDDVTARISQLRAQLRADADKDGGGDGSSGSRGTATRFSALVELGSLLATCSLPAYSAPVRVLIALCC